MPTLTEKNHPTEFLVAEVHPDISREVGILQAGQNLVDGQVVKLSGVKLVTAVAADLTVEEIILGNWNVSVDTKVPYVARLAAVKSSLLKVISGGSLISPTPTVINALGNRNIFLR